jgi:GNAT superfamily N-acetyltransferase
MDLSFRFYKDRDELQIIELLSTVFGQWPSYDIGSSAIAHWKWKYLENPIHPGYVSLCEHENQIVGCLHSIPMNIKIGTSIYKSATGTDLAVHPDYRRRGIYGKMWKALATREKKTGIKFHFGVSGNPIIIKTNLEKNYFYLPYDAFKFILIRDAEKHLENSGEVSSQQRVRVYGYVALKQINKLRNILTGPVFSKRKVSELNEFPENINDFWDHVKGNYNFIVERRREFLNWRYCSKYASSYKILHTESGNRTDGFIVLNIDKINSGYPVGYIVDLVTRWNDFDSAHSLVEDAIQYFDSMNVNMIQWQLLDKHPYVRLAQSYGFLNSRTMSYFSYPTEFSNFGPDEVKLQSSKPKEIMFSFGDYDQI